MNSRHPDYPVWICTDCGLQFCSAREKTRRRIATYHLGQCGVCGETTGVTEPRDFGYPNFPKKAIRK